MTIKMNTETEENELQQKCVTDKDIGYHKKLGGQSLTHPSLHPPLLPYVLHVLSGINEEKNKCT